MRILVLNGPNLGILGRRQPEVYGRTTLDQILAALRERAGEHVVLHLQSNHEGALIDRLEELDYDAVIINPGALTHTSYALHDALAACDRPVVEVHISDTSAREPWRAVSVTAPATVAQIVGHGWQGYLEALDLLLGRDQGRPTAG
ncbi:MAG TPA: type II 3-dehydroquinate dehydratase [Candidatus Limnocylindria bacterium]|nr:type II 3-dehydroquinate dehydratase [Candidatus Limnocylindria bacterium]